MKIYTLFFTILSFFGGILFSLNNDIFTKDACLSIDFCKKYIFTEKDLEKNLKHFFFTEKFKNVYEIIKEKGVDFEKLKDRTNLEKNLISGLVRSLEDPYSAYMTEQQNEEFMENLSGDFEGIGAELQIKDELITIVSPLPDSPAIKAGIKPKDVILKVDGKDVSGWNISDVVKIIRGPKGTKVKLTIYRENEIGFKEINIKRGTIYQKSVKFEIKKSKIGRIGYIKVNKFGDSTVKEFFKSIKEIKKEKVEGIILDLRFNGGGYLDGAVILSSPFLEIGDKIVEIKSKKSSEWKKVSGFSSIFKDKKMIVLINGGSASASEIVSGALRNHKKALLIGTKTFGKGSVQELIPLKGHSSLKITTAKWNTPSGKNINKVGINPDIKVELNYEDFLKGKDFQIETAIKTLERKDFNKLFSKRDNLTDKEFLEITSSGAVLKK